MKKTSANIILVVVIIALLAVVEYSTLAKKSVPVSQELNSAQMQNSESTVIASLKNNWQSVQALIPFRPSYHNQEENKKGIWQSPFIVQFIGKNNILLEIEDDDNPHVIILHFDGDKFNLLGFFKNQYDFALPDYKDLVNKYGDSSYNTSTYTVCIVRNGKIISFQDLTKVPENIFVKN